MQVFLRNAALNISANQQVSGDFGFAYSTDAGGNTDVAVTAANVNGTFGATSLTNASGNLTINDAGISGTLSGHGRLQRRRGFSRGGAIYRHA